jgi:hypothetical protein
VYFLQLSKLACFISIIAFQVTIFKRERIELEKKFTTHVLPNIRRRNSDKEKIWTGLGITTNLIVNGKTIPIKYVITSAGKLLGLVKDKDKTTLLAIISSPSDKGTLTIEVPRNIVDHKKEGNADDKFTIHVDSKDATFRETSNNKTARTLAIDFNKDARLIEIIGTVSTVQ